MWRPSHDCSLVPEEGEQDAGQGTDKEYGVNDSMLFKTTRAELVHEGDQQRPQVGQLDDNCQVGGELPALRQRVDDEWQFHPQTIHRHPGAQAKGTGQNMDKQSHAAAGSEEEEVVVSPLLSE